jgi:hypothetical protein
MLLNGPFAGLACGLLLIAGADFKEFSSKDGKFKAQFPGEPMTKTIDAAGVKAKTFTVEEKNGGYVVSYADLPIPADEGADLIEKRLDGSRDGMVKNIRGTLTGEKKIKLADKYPGREITADLPGKKGVIRARIYIVGKRLYQVLVIGTEDTAKSADATKFLESFQLIQ